MTNWDEEEKTVLEWNRRRRRMRRQRSRWGTPPTPDKDHIATSATTPQSQGLTSKDLPSQSYHIVRV